MENKVKVLSVGEVLWDVMKDGEFLGGAPLNVCANLQRLGDEVLLISGVGNDARGMATQKAMRGLGLDTTCIEVVAGLPTGTAIVRKDARGEAAFLIERPAAYEAIRLSPETLDKIGTLAPDWFYVGTLLQTVPAMEFLVDRLLKEFPGARCFYDMNLREGHWNLALVERLCHRACILKLNEVEAETLAGLHGVPAASFSLEMFCTQWARQFSIDVICITLGGDGCCIFADGVAQRFPGRPVKVADTVGAGDAFAAAFLHGYHQRWLIARCAAFANALGALVASRWGATPAWSMEELAVE